MPTGIYKRTAKHDAARHRFAVGYTPWNKGLKGYLAGVKHHQFGKPQSEDTRRKISLSRKGLGVGARNGKWITDRLKLSKKQERNDSAYKDWRKNVRNRDEWKCRIADEYCGGKVVAHHILPWSKFPELRYQINNGITLCRFHHPRKREDEMRLSPYFQELVAIKMN